MNKTIITLLAIMVVIGAMFTPVMIFSPNNKQKTQDLDLQEEIAQEEILDDCTDEYEEMEYDNTVKANTEEEKTSPNCSFITKTVFLGCGHTKQEYKNLPQDMVNLSKTEIEEKYQDYKIESFASNEVVLTQEKQGNCGEHYKVKDKEGQVTIYQLQEDGTEEEIEVTGITTEYLPETDKITMEKGILVNGKQNLNQLIEDFE